MVSAQPPMRIYRDDSFAKDLGAELLGYAVPLVLCAYWVWSAIVDGLEGGFTWRDALVLAFWIAVAAAVVRWLYRHYCFGRCVEIRLSDDGICELKTRRRVTRLHVNEITSVKYSRDDEGDGETYTIRFREGKVSVRDGITDFRDFLAQLATLNPAVDLTTFPADDWPGIGTPAPARTLNSVARSALFPAIVIVALAWLAIHTLTGS